MKSLLRIFSVCLCMFVLTHIQAIPPPTPPVLDQITLYNQVAIVLTAPNHPTGSFTNIPTNTTITLRFNQNIFKIGGASFGTNEVITSLFTLNNGVPVPFTATINGRVVTIIPNTELKSSTVHTVTLIAGSVEENPTSVQNATQTVTFETATLITPTAPATLNLCQNGVPKVLGDIVITEGSSASFGQGNGQTFEMNAPTGFNFVAGVGTVSATGSDITSATILVTNNKITLTYNIGSIYGATLDVITIQAVQVVWVSGTISQDLKRTGGTATQAGNRVADNVTHATFSSTLPPTAPTPPNYLLTSGFVLGTNLVFPVPNGSTARFYNASNVMLIPVPAIPTSVATTINVTPTQLGYVSNTTLGITQFYMTIITGTCESAKTSFTITVGSVPRIASITLFNANNISLPAGAISNIPTNTSVFLDFNEPIFNTSAVALDNTIIPINITNAIFEFTETTTSLAVTGAVATMVGQRVTITSPELKAATSYTVKLVVNTCQNGLTIRNAEQTIDFTTANAVTVSAPSLLSLCRNGVPQTLGIIAITEGSNASFGEGTNQLFEMNAPTGFNFVAGVGSVATTGSDVSNANLFVTATKVTLVYSVNSSYANANTITIQNLQVIWVSGTASSTPLLRAATSNANHANDGTPKTYATFGSVVAPAAPVLPAAFTSGNLNVCSGFLPANTTTFTVASGSTAKFYDATNTVIYTSVSTGTIAVALSDLGYNAGNNTILGSKQFYMSITNASVCESPKTPFTITNNPIPIVTLINGATNFCQSDVVTFNAVGTGSVNYVFQLSQISLPFISFFSVSTTSSYSPILSAGTYQLRVKAIDPTTGCDNTSNTITFTVVASPPAVSFVWTNSTAHSDAPVAIDLFDVSGVSPFGTYGGRVGTLFNQSGGTYSGAGVVAGKFYPNAAGVGTHIITYTYTSGACVVSATVTFTVFSNNNPILNLNTNYCIESGVSGILTANPTVGGGTTPIPPRNDVFPTIYGLPYTDDNFFFPSNVPNIGVEWSGTQYTFNPASPNVLALFGSSDSFVDITLTIATFIPAPSPPFPINFVACNYYPVNVRVYRVLQTSMNVSLADAQVFCKSDANFAINPLINGVPPSGGTSTMEYRQGVAAFAPFATANTITPSTIPAGTYDMRFTYVSPQGCTNFISKTFTIRDNPTPTFNIRNASGVTVIASTCTNNVLIRLRGAAFTGIGTYTISKTPFSANYSADALGTSATTVLLSDLPGAGVYNITLTVINGSCVGTTAVQTLTVVPVPVADFSFAPLVPLPIINALTICETANSLVLYPDNASLPAGSGYFSIKKTTGGATGKNFVVGVSTFDPLVDFDTNSGMGVGTYEIRYIYTTTTGACVGTSATKLLSIITKPDLSFNLSAFEICRNPVMPNITLTQNWINQGANTFTPANGITRIYASNGVTLLQTLVGAAAYTFNPNTLTTSPTIVTEFKIEVQYTDGIGCVGVSPQRSFFVNPLPIPTIVFASTNIFCLGDGNNATFTVNATGGTVGVFDGTKGFITLRNAPSTPVTATNTTILSNGTNIFNPSSLGGVGVGEYFVDYNYTDNKSCVRTITCPTRLILKFNTTPQFDFPVLGSSYAICETATSLTLTPSLLNTTEYGTDAGITTSRGQYIITKGIYSWSVTSVNTFNPKTLLVDDVNGGAGTYTIKYKYTSALSCVGESTTKQLIINPKPILNFALSNVNICNYATKPIVTLTPTWTNQGANTFIGGSGFFNVYASNGTTLLLQMPNGSNTIDLNITAFAPLMTVVNANPTLVTEFKVEYRYVDSKGCLGIATQQSLFVNPLPVPTISFIGANSFCLANSNVANFTVNATGINIPTFLPASGFITIRNNPTSSPATPAYTEVLANGATNFNVGALLNNSRVGEYFVDYTYTDTKNCAVTVTCPTMLIHNFYSAPDFLFQGGATSYTICETATSLVLNPSLTNTTAYGTDNSLVPASGNYLITRGAFTLVLPGTTPLNPQTMLVGAGGGVGTYNIQYRYTSARGCYGESSVRQLIINARPALDFSFLPTPAEVCNNPTRPLIQVVPSWTNATSAFLPSNGKLRVYISGGTVPILTLIGTYTIDPNATAFSGLISASAITVFDVEFEYVDINNSNCVGISVRKSFQLNPLPVPTITFSSVSNFCFGDGVSATFNLGATGAGVPSFVPANGTISLRNNNASSPTTPAYTYTFAAGVNSFNPSALVGILVGEYYIDYTYIDAKGCILKVTCSTLLKLRALPAVSFKFPFGQESYAICESVTNVVLVPSIANGNAYGSENTLNISRGEYIFTKGAFTVSLFNTNTFDPRAFLVTAGGGTGVYTVSYKYTTALGCDGFSTTLTPLQTLTIYPLPVPTFSFDMGDTAFCESEANFTLIPLVNGVTPSLPSPAVGYFTITKIAPSLGVPLQVAGGVNSILISTLSGPGTYRVRYTYVDGTLCENISAPQTFIINALPATAVVFPAGDNAFCADETTATVNIAYAGVLNPLESFITIAKNTYSLPLPAGVNTFDPSSLAANVLAGVGIYSIVHGYKDANGCEKTTAPITFSIYALPAATFLFQTSSFPAPSLSICANVTLVTLLPDISNAGDYGVGPFANALGYFTILKGGAFVTQLPNGVNSFNPNNPALLLTSSAGGLVGNYEITYTYRTLNGCEKTTSAINNFVINPLPPSSFTFLASSVAELNVLGDVARVCASFSNNIVLQVPPPIGITGSYVVEIQEIVTAPTPIPALIQLTSLSISPLNLNILPTTSTVREFEIRLRYTNVNGCVQVSTPKILRVVPLPATTFIFGTQRCAGIAVSFNGSSVTQATDLVASYQWNFNDGSTTANVTTTVATTNHQFAAAGTYPVSLTITSVLGCSKTYTTNVIIGAIPVAGFTTASFCEGSSTSFASNSTLAGTGSIDNYAWDFGDGSSIFSSSSPTTTHLYATPKRYVATLTVTTNNLCTHTSTREVFIFPRITPTAAMPYKENFDATTDPNTWFANGLIKSTVNPTQDITGFSWKRGVPTGAKIKASTTNGGAWSTTGNANTFYPNERSYVESPCFNFSDPTLTKPIISMKVWYDTDRGSDGAVLYSSINDGITWNVVGTINEGIEWYNTAGIIAQPGGQSVVNAWTGNTFTEYKIAKFNLDQFKGLPSVRFRVAFGSNADNPVGTTFDGFAFDEVFIGNRNRISLLEHFTNASSSEANTENTVINNFPSGLPQNEIYNIQYHTNVPGADPMNADNTAVPSARALFYGVSQVPRTAIDGYIENRKFSEWGMPVYNKRTLEASPFELSVDFSSTAQQLRFKANVKALEPFTRRVILHTVVIEQEILGTAFTGGNFGGLTFKNVVKGMIPNASGTLIAQTWLQNTQFQTGELVWANVPKIYNGNKLVLVVFVQDEVTKEIYQAGFFNITTNISAQDPTTALDPQTLENEFVVYPNPAQNEVFTGFREETAEDFKVVIFDSYGKRLDTFSLTKGNKGLLLNTEKYASGMYFVEITGKNNSKARRKLVIAR